MKKKNADVHAARNIIVKIVRGKYYAGLDCNYEMLLSDLSTFLKICGSIPKDKINEFLIYKLIISNNTC